MAESSYNLVKMGSSRRTDHHTPEQAVRVPHQPAQFKIDPTIVKLVPTDTARKYQIIPLSRSAARSPSR